MDHTEGTGGDQWGVTYVMNDPTAPANGTPPTLTTDQFQTKRLGPAGSYFTTLCDAACNPGPTPQTNYVGQKVTFSVVPDGTPPYRFQWSSNGVPISGATAAIFTTAPLSEANEGDSYAVQVSNFFSSNSCSAAVHVLHNPIVVSASTRNDINHIYVVYNKPVKVVADGSEYAFTDNSGLFVQSAGYLDATHTTVV